MPNTNLPEKYLSWIALFTIFYYLTTFAYEIGYFYGIGVEHMSLFSFSDYTIHAASTVIPIFVSFVPLFVVSAAGFIFSMTRPNIRVASNGESISNYIFNSRSTLSVIILLILGIFAISTIIAIGAKVYNYGTDLLDYALVICTISVGSLFLVPSYYIKRLSVPLFSTIIASASIIYGYGSYKEQVLKPIYNDSVVIGSDRYDAVLVFGGSSKSIYATCLGLFLVSDGGDQRIFLRGRPEELRRIRFWLGPEKPAPCTKVPRPKATSVRQLH